MREAFSRLEKQVNWVPLVTNPPSHTLLITSRCRAALRTIRDLEDDNASRVRISGEIRTQLAKLEAEFKAIESTLESAAEFRSRYCQLQGVLDEIHGILEQYLSADEWNRGDSESLNREMERSWPDRKSTLSPSARFRVVAEEFIALRHLMYMRYVFRHLRNLLGFVIGGFILAILATTVYPFQGERWLAFTGAVAFVILAIGVGMVFAQMDRDRIMSRITDTTGGRLGSTFFVRIAQFGALPLATVIATQFPSINRIFFSWVQPALEALK